MLDERVFVTLGILKIAACLEKAGYPVEMMDLSGVKNYEEVTFDHASVTTAQIFGLTATTPQMPYAYKIALQIRRANPLAKIIIGGPHATLVCAALKKEKKRGEEGRAHRAYADLERMADVIVAGDGEDAMFLAIQPTAPKYIDADDPNGELFMTNGRLDELPWPARHLVDMESYHYSIEGVRSYSIIGQLGCPFGCRFCGGRESPMLRRIRTRSVGNIIGEIEHIADTYDVRGFMFYDDETNVSPAMIEMMNGLHDLQKKMSTEFKMRGFIKSQLFNDAQAAAMYRAGFRWILVGFESGSERILSNIKKKATRVENTRCMDIARRHGLKVKALMSIGHAGESEATIQETKDWLLEVKPDDFDATCITVFPGTPYHGDATQTEKDVWTYVCPENGDRLHSYELNYTESAGFYKGVPGEYKSYVFTDFLTPEQLVSMRDNLEEEVREKLGIPFNQSAASINYDHSMGMGISGQLPKNILRTTGVNLVVPA